MSHYNFDSYYDLPHWMEYEGPCEVCGGNIDADQCICEPCPVCDQAGDPACAAQHAAYEPTIPAPQAPVVTPPAFAIGDKVQITLDAVRSNAAARKARDERTLLTVAGLNERNGQSKPITVTWHDGDITYRDWFAADELEAVSANTDDVIASTVRTEVDIEREKADAACMSWWAECERLEAERDALRAELTAANARIAALRAQENER